MAIKENNNNNAVGEEFVQQAIELLEEIADNFTGQQSIRGTARVMKIVMRITNILGEAYKKGYNKCVAENSDK